MAPGSINPHQCVKCGAPVGAGGGRCPFCGTEQPKIANDPSQAAAVGLTDVNRARMGRPPIHAKPKSNAGLFVGIAVGGVFLVGAIGGVVGWLVLRPAPATTTSTETPTATAAAQVPPQVVGGVSVADPARVDPTDLLPKLRAKVSAWDPDAKLLEIHVAHAKNGTVDVTEPNAEVVIRYVAEKRDPQKPKGKDVSKQRMAFTLKKGAGEPEHAPGAPTDKGVAEPNCVWSAAHRAAVKAGLVAAGPVDARYVLDAKSNEGTWTFTSQGATREVDGNTCAIKASR